MVQIYSHNVNGLNSNFKRQLALRSFKDSGAEVIFIQETHFNKTGTLAFASLLLPTGYLASNTKKKAGVAILIRKGSPFTPTSSYSDPQGRFLILTKWQQSDITFCNIYAPNVNQMPFVTKVYNHLFRTKHSFLVVGRDFNLPSSPTSARTSLTKKITLARLSRQSKQLRQVTCKFALFDAWRVERPVDRQYSHYSHPFSTHACLDYFFVNAPSLRALADVNILPMSWSDHAPISFTLKLHPSKVRRCHWRLNRHWRWELHAHSPIKFRPENFYKNIVLSSK